MSGRGIAFVTYKSEANAQFAKEAMMHQSLDNQEVLNIRWSAEDPRAGDEGEADAERREQGERHIAAVEQSLEEQRQDYEELQHRGDIDWDDYARAKRQRVTMSAEEMQRLDEDNQRGWHALRSERENHKGAADGAATAPQPAPPQPAGLLSGDALRSLEALRGKAPAKAAAKAGSGLSSLAAYGSDSD